MADDGSTGMNGVMPGNWKSVVIGSRQHLFDWLIMR